MSEYTPISCDVYDALILIIQRKLKVNIVLKSGAQFSAVPIDIFTKEKREFLKTDTHQILDFADIAMVDNHRFDKVCFTHGS
ncbi:MAG: hypothetical protein HKN09_04020 [Saprospiraceae bacterium]|nr:hypothetical protein [Saprospiraceae bacterium]